MNKRQFLERALKKLDRPPSVHNWARYNSPDLLKTTKALVNFVTGMPTVTYGAGMVIARDRVVLELATETALRAARERGHLKSRPHVEEFIEAFLAYDEGRGFSRLPAFDQFVEPFRVSQTIKLPAQPLAVIFERGKLKPIFLIPWRTLPFSLFQMRLHMTVVEDAVFTLTDFRMSEGEFIAFPANSEDKREATVWKRGDFDLLSADELREQTDLYLRALEAARQIIRGRIAITPAEDARQEQRPPEDDAPRLPGL